MNDEWDDQSEGESGQVFRTQYEDNDHMMSDGAMAGNEVLGGSRSWDQQDGDGDITGRNRVGVSRSLGWGGGTYSRFYQQQSLPLPKHDWSGPGVQSNIEGMTENLGGSWQELTLGFSDNAVRGRAKSC